MNASGISFHVTDVFSEVREMENRFVSDMTADCWTGNADVGKQVCNPTWDQIEGAIHALDGKTRTLVTMGGEGEAHMAIGGGKDGRYVCYATFDNEIFHNLLNPSKQEGIVMLVAGGQEGDYSAKMIVDLDAVLAAARTFAENGELDQSVEWETDE
jgi:hypothetical protein